ncbi:MAG: ABC transporter permease [Nitriliruptorales bacterium]|nr:ABC transporter permease [Nitriliruptorales bacterium]
MFKTISLRLVQMLILFVVFLTLLFFLIQLAPGSPADRFIGNPQIPPQARQLLIERFGLDQSLWGQYWSYITAFFQGDLGVSFNQYPRPVMDIILERMPRTIWLFFGATVLAYYFGFILGKYLAWRRGGFSEYSITIIGVFLFTVFVPWFAIMMIWFWSFILGIFPTGKFLDPVLWRSVDFSANDVFVPLIVTAFAALIGAGLFTYLAKRFRGRPGLSRLFSWGGSIVVVGGFVLYWASVSDKTTYALDIAYHTVLPTMTVALIAFGGVMLLMRTSMLETLAEDYILTARAKGLPDSVVRDRHAARNALLPVVTSLVLALATIIGGGIVTETIFAWPGLGLTLLQSAVSGDHPLALGALAFVGVLALVGHLVVDILYTYLDPRIRFD